MSSKEKETDSSDFQLTGLLGYGSSFKGEIWFDGMFRLDGNLSGRIVCERNDHSTVIVSKGSVVHADIIADNVIISGKVFGNILAMNKIEIFSDGRLEGLIFSKDLIVREGAFFTGQSVALKNFPKEKAARIREDLLENRSPLILEEIGVEKGNIIEHRTQET